MRPWPFIVVAGLALSGCIIGPEGAFCSADSSCEACIELAGCGWCQGVGCVEGSSLGPAGGGFCPDYRWDTCAPPVVEDDPCRIHAGCATCLMASRCEWCGHDRAGPCTLDGAACPGAARTFCAPPSCSDYIRCGDCDADPACAWLQDTLLYCSRCPTFPGSGTCVARGLASCDI